MDMWFLVLWSVWRIVRKNDPVLALAPGLGLVGGILSVVGKPSASIVFLFGLAIALMVLFNHHVLERPWLSKQMVMSARIRRNITIASLSLISALMLFAVITPSISLETIDSSLKKLSGNATSDQPTLAESLGLDRQEALPEDELLESMRVGGLPNQHLIGSGPDLSDRIVMQVKVDPPFRDQVESPLYLRYLVYDRYTGWGWESRSTKIDEYSPGEKIIAGEQGNSVLVRQQITLAEDSAGFLYSVGDPSSADRDFKVAWRVKDHTNGIYDFFGGTVDAVEYRVDSHVKGYRIEELRQSGQDYPDWIVDRYMRLPPTVPENVISLALALTAAEPTPFDRSVAIEQYLREITYTTEVTRPPFRSDVVEYFIFDLRKGYCDYYATAMVVLARAAGIPARYVVGYLGDAFDQAEGAYVITADQAHAWPEIYFPGYGWVAFEPTGGRTGITHQAREFADLPTENEMEMPPLVPESRLLSLNWQQILWLLAFVGLVLVIGGWGISDWLLGRMPADRLIPEIYKRLYRYGRWAGLRVQVRDTPYQFADNLVDLLVHLGTGSRWSTWLLEGVGMVRTITSDYVQFMFDPLGQNMGLSESLSQFRQLRYRLWLLWLLSRVNPYPVLKPLFWKDDPDLILHA
jgi:transglutaminase-like putative cysteine protease